MQVLIEAMKAQLAKPARAVVNSESAFVKDRISMAGEPELARQYWNWVCSGRKTPIFGEEVFTLQQQLDAIDKGVTMPDWGTYGT